MEKFLRKIAVNVCGALFAPFLWSYRLARLGWIRLKQWRENKQILRSIRWANKLAAATGYRYYVLKANRRIVVRPKQAIKNMLACNGKYFKRGTKIQDIERIALHITK